MVKAKFTFFQMKVKSVLGQTPKTNKSCFGKSPEALNAVNVWVFIGKFIVAMLNPEVFLVA